MQIHRYDSDAHGYAQPKIAPRAADQQGSASGVGSSATHGHSSASKTETSDSRWATLVARLNAEPAVRHSAVEAARGKVARGEFTTREAARQLAATDLQNDLF